MNTSLIPIPSPHISIKFNGASSTQFVSNEDSNTCTTPDVYSIATTEYTRNVSVHTKINTDTAVTFSSFNISNSHTSLTDRTVIVRYTDLHWKDTYSKTQLHVSIIRRYFESVQHLIQLGVDINIANDDGFTALHIAASKDNTQIVKLLLAAGATPMPQVAVGTPSNIPITQENEPTVSLLRSKID